MTVQKILGERRVSSLIAAVLKDEVPKPDLYDVSCHIRCTRTADGTGQLSGTYRLERSTAVAAERPMSQSDIFDFLFLALCAKGYSLASGDIALWRHIAVEPTGSLDAEGNSESFRLRISDLIH